MQHPATLARPLHHLQKRRAERENLAFCRQLARLAVRSLYQELVLYPKPGLVSRWTMAATPT
jgi:triphosphoribosyl-dephospho-CoA synthase